MDSIADQIRAIAREEATKLLAERNIGVPPPPATTLVTVADYARARSISESTVRVAIRDGRLAAQRIGRAVRVRPEDEIARPMRAAKIDYTATARRRLGLR